MEQKQKLDTADSFLVGMVAALMGVGAYYLQMMARADSGFALIVFLLLSSPYFVALLVALCYVIASIWPREKAYIASPQQWADYVEGYKTYYATWHEDPVLTEKTALELAKLRRQQYIEAGETNRKLILKKHGYQTWAKRSIVAAVILMLPITIPVFWVQRTEHGVNKNEQPITATTPTTTTTDSSNAPGAPNSTDAPFSPGGANTSDDGNSTASKPATSDQTAGGRNGTKESVKENAIMSEQGKNDPPAQQPPEPAVPPKPDPPPVTKVHSQRNLGDKLPLPPISHPPQPPPTPPTEE